MRPTLPGRSLRTARTVVGATVVLILTLAAAPVSAHRFAPDTFRPVDNLPFRLVVTGELVNYLVAEVLPPVPDDGVLRVELVAVPAGGILAPPQVTPYVRSVPVGPLAAGRHDVEVVARTTDGSYEELLASGQIHVAPGFDLDVPAIVSEQAASLPLSVSGVASCPYVGEPRVEDGTIVVLYDDNCPILPPDPSPFTVDFEVPGPFEPGDLAVEMRWRVDGGLAARAAVTVLPEPVTLREERFRVELGWRDALGEEGRGMVAAQPSEESALFYFFTAENWEVMVKVLDGCALNGHWWVFAAALTDVEYTLVVEDLVSGEDARYFNPLGTAAPAITDTAAIPCSQPGR